MRISTRFSDAIHLLAFTEVYKNIKITSELIAVSIQTSPVVVRRLTSTLRDAELLTNDSETKQLTMAKPPKDITLFDVFMATEGYAQLFTIDKDTNPLCIVGGNIQDVLREYYDEAQTAAYAKLNSITMQNVIDQILVRQKVKEALEKTANRDELN